MERTQCSMAAILARQRADTIEAISHTAEWSASVAMVLQQLLDPQVQQDFIAGKIIGTNAGGVLVNISEGLVMLGAINDIFHPPWSSSAVERRGRAQTRGYHVSLLLMESEQPFDIPGEYGAVPELTYRAVYNLLQGLIQSSYWEGGSVKTDGSESQSCYLKPRSRQQQPRDKVWRRQRKAQAVNKSEVSVACKPKVSSSVALVQVASNVEPCVTSAVDGEDSQQKGKVNASIYRSGRIRCWFCRGMGHKKTNCLVRKKRCYSCQKLGHIARYCHSKHISPELQVRGKFPAGSNVIDQTGANKQCYSVGLVSVKDSSNLPPKSACLPPVLADVRDSFPEINEQLSSQSGCRMLPEVNTGVINCCTVTEGFEDHLPSQPSTPYDDIPMDDSLSDFMDYLPFGLPPVANRACEETNTGDFYEDVDGGEDQASSVLDWSLQEDDNVSHGSQTAGSSLTEVCRIGGKLLSDPSKEVGSASDLKKRIPTVNLWKYHIGW